MHDDFFTGVEQVEFEFDGGIGKLPIFYRGARSFTAMMPASYFKLRRLVPDPRFAIAQVLPGVGALSLTAFEYSDTDIGPYNEFSVGVLVNNPLYAPAPCYNMLRQYLDRFYYVYVHRLPVTTEIALRAGVDFYNYPKFIAGIEFEESGGGVTCELTGDGDRILALSGNKVPTGPIGEMKFMCQLYQYRKPQQAEFKLNVVDGAIRWGSKDVSVELNPSNPIGREIADVLLSPRALMYLYMPEIQGILYGPDNYSMPLLSHALEKGSFPSVESPPGAASGPEGTTKKKGE